MCNCAKTSRCRVPAGERAAIWRNLTAAGSAKEKAALHFSSGGKKIKQKVQLVLYMPNFISVIVLCGIVRVLLSVTGPVNGLLHTSINFMTLPEAFVLYPCLL